VEIILWGSSRIMGTSMNKGQCTSFNDANWRIFQCNYCSAVNFSRSYILCTPCFQINRNEPRSNLDGPLPPPSPERHNRDSISCHSLPFFFFFFFFFRKLVVRTPNPELKTPVFWPHSPWGPKIDCKGLSLSVF
jgi:hypothetical protein